jgi:hypothetical protein
MTGLTAQKVEDDFKLGTAKTLSPLLWFAGEPLDWPPLSPKGYNLWAAPGFGRASGSGHSSKSITNSPAPYAWRKYGPTTGGSVSQGDLKKFKGWGVPIPTNTYSPIFPNEIPYVPKGGFGVGFLNDLGTYACDALATGLKVVSVVEPTGIGKSINTALKNNAKTLSFFTNLCGGK